VATRIGFGETSCPLCGNEEESLAHLFLKCHVIKPLWFGLSWGLHPNLIPADSCTDFLNLVINPPICPGHWVNPKTLKAQCSIQIALILECVWRIWNQIVHNDAKVNLLAEEKNLEDRIIEHLQVLQPAKSTVISAPHLWKAPPAHIVKLNTDAAIIDLGATIAVVARYSNGSLFQGWTKILLTSDPCIAEAVALLWALEIARAVHMPDIIVEEDAKLCCDAFNDGSAAIP
jgi:hypothetical protein